MTTSEITYWFGVHIEARFDTNEPLTDSDIHYYASAVRGLISKSLDLLEPRIDHKYRFRFQSVDVDLPTTVHPICSKEGHKWCRVMTTPNDPYSADHCTRCGVDQEFIRDLKHEVRQALRRYEGRINTPELRAEVRNALQTFLERWGYEHGVLVPFDVMVNTNDDGSIMISYVKK